LRSLSPIAGPLYAIARGNPFEHEDIHKLIAAPLDGCPECGGLVVWARDHRTYKLLVQELIKTGWHNQ